MLVAGERGASLIPVFSVTQLSPFSPEQRRLQALVIRLFSGPVSPGRRLSHWDARSLAGRCTRLERSRRLDCLEGRISWCPHLGEESIAFAGEVAYSIVNQAHNRLLVR